MQGQYSNKTMMEIKPVDYADMMKALRRFPISCICSKPVWSTIIKLTVRIYPT